MRVLSFFLGIFLPLCVLFYRDISPTIWQSGHDIYPITYDLGMTFAFSQYEIAFVGEMGEVQPALQLLAACLKVSPCFVDIDIILPSIRGRDQRREATASPPDLCDRIKE